MKWKQFVFIGTAFVVSGCAAVSSSSLQKQCGDTTASVVEKFLTGVAEFDLGMIRSVIPDGISTFAIFGNGDTGRGRKIVGNIVDHPEVHRGNEVDSTYHAADIKDTSEEKVKEVSVERHDRVMLMNGNKHNGYDDIQTIEQHSRRVFVVAFDSKKNCILAVNSINPEWIRIP